MVESSTDLHKKVLCVRWCGEGGGEGGGEERRREEREGGDKGRRTEGRRDVHIKEVHLQLTMECNLNEL